MLSGYIFFKFLPQRRYVFFSEDIRCSSTTLNNGTNIANKKNTEKNNDSNVKKNEAIPEIGKRYREVNNEHRYFIKKKIISNK